MLRTALPALVLLCAAGCADDQAAERTVEVQIDLCRTDIALQASHKIADEPLSVRVDRLRQMEIECPAELYGEALRVDQEAAIEWLKIVAARPAEQEN